MFVMSEMEFAQISSLGKKKNYEKDSTPRK